MLFRKPALSYIEKLEMDAKKVLSKEIYDHIAGGAGDESTVRRNRCAYSEIVLIPKVLKNVVSVDTSIQILGVRANIPILVAPMSFHGLVNKEKELGTAAAAKEVKTVMAVSMMANTTLEDIALSTGSPLWFQVHIHADHTVTQELIKRAEKSGYKGIIITVDIPQKGIRTRDVNNDFKLPSDCVPVNFIDPVTKQINSAGVQFNAHATWNDVKWIKSITRLPIILKGVLNPLDAIKAVEVGVDAIIVSNHGGRQLESVVGTVEILPEIVKAVYGKIPVLIDGGIRSGVDIIKAIAIGADAVLVGRPILWALAIKGKQGVIDVLSTLTEQLVLSMQLVGCASIKEIKDQGHMLVRKLDKRSEEMQIFEDDIKRFSELQKTQIENLNHSQKAKSAGVCGIKKLLSKLIANINNLLT